MTFKQHCISELERIETKFRIQLYEQNTGNQTKLELFKRIIELKPDTKIAKYEGSVTDEDKAFWSDLPKPNFEAIRKECFSDMTMPTTEDREVYRNWYQGKVGIEKVNKLMLP